LEAVDPDRFVVRLGTKFVEPFIEDAMADLAAAGTDNVLCIVLTPHQSSMGSGEYFARAQAAADGVGTPPRLTVIPSWHRAPGFARILADRTGTVLDTLGPESRASTAVFFTAHSLPQRVVAEGDPYPAQVAETGAGIAALLDLDSYPSVTWGTAWQSAGRTPDPWIGPDLLTEMERVAGEGATAVVVCPVGFVSDHLEILYDLDIEARSKAESLGIAFARTPSLNDDPKFLAILAEVIRSAADDAP
jgi:ferrochelatase